LSAASLGATAVIGHGKGGSARRRFVVKIVFVLSAGRREVAR
jgi:hypothetical protein